MRFLVRFIAVAGAALAPAVALAQAAPKTAPVRIDAVTVNVVVPEGYCVMDRAHPFFLRLALDGAEEQGLRLIVADCKRMEETRGGTGAELDDFAVVTEPTPEMRVQAPRFAGDRTKFLAALTDEMKKEGLTAFDGKIDALKKAAADKVKTVDMEAREVLGYMTLPQVATFTVYLSRQPDEGDKPRVRYALTGFSLINRVPVRFDTVARYAGDATVDQALAFARAWVGATIVANTRR
jgi:hypothetical protein